MSEHMQQFERLGRYNFNYVDTFIQASETAMTFVPALSR